MAANQQEHRAHSVDRHDMGRIGREHGILSCLRQTGTPHIEIQGSPDIRHFDAVDPGVDCSVIFRKVARLPAEMRQRRRHRHGMLPGAGAYLENLPGICQFAP